MTAAVIASHYVADSYKPEVLADNPLFYIEFDEITGQWLDSSPNGYHFPYSGVGVRGAPGVRPDSVASAYGPGTSATGGLGQRADVKPALGTPSGQFSVECWVNVPAGNVRGAVLSTGAQNGWAIGLGDGNSMDAVGRYIMILAQYVAWSAPAILPGGARSVHLVWTCNAGNWTVYINGFLVGTATRGFNTASQLTSLAGVYETGAWIRGLGTDVRLDSMSVYDKVLTQARVSAHLKAVNLAGFPLHTGKSSSQALGGGEGAIQVFDNNTNTKWFSGSNTNWVQFSLDGSIRSYTLTYGNDSAERDPKDWKLEGTSDGGATWVTVDSRTGQASGARYGTATFDLPALADHGAYRFTVLNTQNGGPMQYSGINFFSAVSAGGTRREFY